MFRQEVGSDVPYGWNNRLAAPRSLRVWVWSQPPENGAKQAKEISQLAPFLLKGTRRALPSNAEHVHVFLWEKDAKKILVVFNTDRNASTDLHMAIPDSAGQTLAALFANRPTGLELKGGILRGRIRPEEVHVYAVSESAQPQPLEP